VFSVSWPSLAHWVLIDGGRRVVYGTDDGVYISDLRDTTREPSRVLALLEVSQVDVLEEYQLLIVLSGKWRYVYDCVGLINVVRATSDYLPA